MPSPANIAAAAAALSRGDLVAFPTETVYGLGADASNPLAVRRIFAAKGRPADHPLIVHLAPNADVTRWAQLDDRARALIDAHWPGPLTLVLARQPWVPDEVTGGLHTIGVRVPSHPIAQALLTAFGGGVAAPSANRFGRVSPTTAAHVRAELGDTLHILDGGPCAVGVESTIVDLSGPTAALLRPGGVTRAEIERTTGPLQTGSATPAPGTLPGHYAPRTALRLHPAPHAEAARARAQGLRVAVLEAGPVEQYARDLYAALRRLDSTGVDLLVAQPAPEGGLGDAINDRLQRAAFGAGEPSADQ